MITRLLKVRVCKHPDGLFTAEYKGWFFWKSCYYRVNEDAWLYPVLESVNIPRTYRTVEDAIDATTEFVESQRIAAKTQVPVVVYKNTAEVEL